MQRKGNLIARGSQMENLVTVGIDMGGSLWATAIHDWTTGHDSYFAYRNKDDICKEERLYDKIRELLANDCHVQVFYEAGRYGYAPARIMKGLGADVSILPVNKLKVIMCGKVIKTDRLDAQFLAGLHPEDKLPEVYIPTLEEEGRRDAERELIRLRKSTGRVNAQLLAIIERSELKTPKGHLAARVWQRQIVSWHKSGELAKLPRLMALRLKNMLEELQMTEKHQKEWEDIIDCQMKQDRLNARKKQEQTVIDKLKKFRGIGDAIARHFVWEIGDFSRFKNGKQFSSYFGMTPCPFSSGTTKREQGISKFGRNSLRKMAVEMAWLWCKWQPESHLSQKWKTMLDQKGRARRTAIVAMARQLLVALWRNIVHNEPVAGTIINKPLKTI